MIACYSLQHRLPTYDFFCWLVHVALLGASAITIDPGRKFFMRKKWPPEETLRRLDNYIKPGPALLGLSCRIGSEGDREIGSHLMRDLWADVQRLGHMPRLRSVLPPAQERYTVTIRDCAHKPERNSDRETWTRFARAIDARLIDDYDHERVGLHDRVALYAGAERNFGVPNGPLSLLWWTGYPIDMWCDPDVTAADFARQDIAVGGQVPWCLPHQRLIWQKPTLDRLMDAFDAEPGTT